MPKLPPPPPDDAPAVVRLGDALRRRREALPGIRSREQLAERLEYSAEVVRNIENGHYGARLQRYLTRWEQTFGLDEELEELWRRVQAEQQHDRRQRPEAAAVGVSLISPTRAEAAVPDPRSPSGTSEQDEMNRLAFLQSVATLAGASFLPPFQTESLTSNRVDPDALLQLDRFIELVWRLSQGEEVVALDYLLPAYLPRLTMLAQEPSKDQRRLAALTAQGCLLAGLVSVVKQQSAAGVARL